MCVCGKQSKLSCVRCLHVRHPHHHHHHSTLRLGTSTRTRTKRQNSCSHCGTQSLSSVCCVCVADAMSSTQSCQIDRHNCWYICGVLWPATLTNIALATIMSDPYEHYKCAGCQDFCDNAVETGCCHTLLCGGCGSGTTTCPACLQGRYCRRRIVLKRDHTALALLHSLNNHAAILSCADIKAPPTPNYPIRRIISKLQLPCTHSGCSELVLYTPLHSVHSLSKQHQA